MGRAGDRRPEGRARRRRPGSTRSNVTTAWVPGQTSADPRGADDPAQRRAVRPAKRDMHVVITAYAPRPVFAPVSEEEQQNYAEFVATIARELPSLQEFAVWNEPNLNELLAVPVRRRWRGHRATRLHLPAREDLRRAEGGQPGDQRLRRQSRTARIRRRRARRGRRIRRRRSSAKWARPTGRAGGRSRSWTSSAIHPYQTRSSIPPGQPHTGTSLGIGDYDKLVALLGEAFDGTAQPGLGPADRLHGVRRPVGDPRERAGVVHQPRLAART